VNAVVNYFRDLGRATLTGWQRFWFTPADPATLGLIRILAGAMLFYTHLVWGLDLEAFFGRQAWLTPEAVAAFAQSVNGPEARDFSWSYFWWIDSPRVLWSVHIAALVVFALLTVGLFSRTSAVLAYLAAVSYVNRVPGAQFGLDQINVMLAMYLMVGPCGSAYSLDRLIRKARAGGNLPRLEPSVGANISIRLIQLHMCIIYLFAGLSKLAGVAWWDGSALWLSFANLEYQSLDMTWTAHYPLFISFLTHVTIAWEVSYAALVWPKLTRPLVIALAIPLHLGIAFCMGMITFGLIMLVGNLAYVSPGLVRSAIDTIFRTRSKEPIAPVAMEPAASSQAPRIPRRKAGNKSRATH